MSTKYYSRDSQFFGAFFDDFFIFFCWNHDLRENWDRKRVDTLKITTILIFFCWDFLFLLCILSIVSEKFRDILRILTCVPRILYKFLFLDASVVIHLRLNIPTLFLMNLTFFFLLVVVIVDKRRLQNFFFCCELNRAYVGWLSFMLHTKYLGNIIKHTTSRINRNELVINMNMIYFSYIDVYLATFSYYVATLIYPKVNMHEKSKLKMFKYTKNLDAIGQVISLLDLN